MDLPQGSTDSMNFLEHIELVKKYSGTIVAYCREHNLDYGKFMYHRGRAMNTRKSPAAVGFARIQPTVAASAHVMPAAAKPKSYPQLPDPKWLAQLIHNLSGTLCPEIGWYTFVEIDWYTIKEIGWYTLEEIRHFCQKLRKSLGELSNKW